MKDRVTIHTDAEHEVCDEFAEHILALAARTPLATDEGTRPLFVELQRFEL